MWNQGRKPHWKVLAEVEEIKVHKMEFTEKTFIPFHNITDVSTITVDAVLHRQTMDWQVDSKKFHFVGYNQQRRRFCNSIHFRIGICFIKQISVPSIEVRLC